MKTTILAFAILTLSIATSFASANERPRLIQPPPPPKGFYCSATAWRVYRELPPETETVSPIAGTHRVLEQSPKNKENDGKGVLAQFKPGKDPELVQNLEFNHGYAVVLRALSAPNGSVTFVIKLATRVGGKVTNILGEHRAIYQGDPKGDKAPLSASIPNLEVSNTYLHLGITGPDDRNFDKLALSVGKGQLTDGVPTEAMVECTPEF